MRPAPLVEADDLATTRAERRSWGCRARRSSRERRIAGPGSGMAFFRLCRPAGASNASEFMYPPGLYLIGISSWTRRPSSEM